MAKIVQTDNRYIFNMNSWARVVLVGAALGVIVLALSWVIGKFIVDPLLCRGGNLAACGNSEVLAGNIAAVIAAIAGASALIRLRVYRSILVALAVLISFWGIASLGSGLRWAELAAWMAGLYGLSYLLFAHIFRIRSIFVAVIIAIIAVLALRWVAFL